MKYLFVVITFLLVSCKNEVISPLDNALKSEHPAIKKVMENLNEHEVQIIYTQIDKDKDGKTIFTDYKFQLDNLNYFYPASTVKLPAAIQALEFCERTSIINPDTEYLIEGDSITHTIRDDIRQIFAVSDNDAYNRIYEILGRDHINSQISAKNVGPIRIAHRLGVSEASNNVRKKIKFFAPRNIALKKDKALHKISVKNNLKGIGFMRNDTLISTPFDFSEKNYFPLETQHNILKRIFFESNFSVNNRFTLRNDSKELLKYAMFQVPRKVGYDEAEFYDSYGKFFIFGDSKNKIPDGIKIYNKVGYAYGTVTDSAYIVDTENDIAFILSATLLVNKNGIFNDNVYEYEETGVPFLAQLGREIYSYEMNRKK